jgi:hypothetical protein
LGSLESNDLDTEISEDQSNTLLSTNLSDHIDSKRNWGVTVCQVVAGVVDKLAVFHRD